MLNKILKPFKLEEYLANPSKKIVTRSGKDVRILCTDAKGDFPIIALIDELTDNCIYHSVYTKEGHVKPYDIPTRYDLFFASEKREGWINILKNDSVFPDIYETQDLAKEYGMQRPDYIDTIKIEWEE